jgi:membrane fusion protein, hemolysin D
MSNLPSLARQRRDVSVNVLVSAFESETASVIVRTTPRSEHLILYVLMAMLAIALGLASITKLDRVVSGTGKVISSEGSLYVQPLDKAIVRSIKVKVGDVVKKGQLLATLDPTFAGADFAQYREKVASTKALVARLDAENGQRIYSPVDGDRYQVLQEAIFQQRQSEYMASLADFDSRIRNAEAKIVGLQQDAVTYRERLKVATDIENMQAKLERDGWGSRLKTLTATDTRVEIGRLLAESDNEIKATQQTLDGAKAQRAVYVEKWRSDIASQLATARDDLTRSEEELEKARKLNQLVSLVAPADAVVLKIGNASSGSIVGPAIDASQGALFTLVPLDDKLEAELRVDARDIGFIRVGDPVVVKLMAYDYLRHGTAKGVIKTISEGSFTDGDGADGTRSPYFKVRVAFTDTHLRDVPSSFRLIPGMTLQGDVRIGKRTIMSYLLGGVLRTSSEAMREP